MLKPRTIVLLTALLSAPSLVAAQSFSTVDTGSRVRLWTPAAEQPVIGKVTSQTTTTLTLKVDGGGPPQVIARERVTRLELGHRRSWAATVAWGTLIGAAGGFAYGYAQGDDPPGEWSFDRGSKGFIFGVLGTPVGFITGLIIGPGKDHWSEVGSKTTATLTPVVTRSRIGLAGSVRW